MKKIIYIAFVIFTLIFPGVNMAAGTLDQRADSAYMADAFPLAIELYNQAIIDDGCSSTLYYNLANAYYRDGNLGQAIINYERALKLDPTNEDAKINLEFVNSRIADKPVDNATLSNKLADKIINWTTADAWAWITLSLFVILIFLIAGYIFTGSVPVRKICFFGGLFIFVLVVAGVIISITSANRMTNNNNVVIISEAVQLGTSPREPKDKTEQAFLLHEGTKLTIVDSLTVATDTTNPKWYEVKIDNDHRAWINAKDVEKI